MAPPIADVPRADSIPRLLLGRYRIEAIMRTDGYLDTVKAYDTRLKRFVTIKTADYSLVSKRVQDAQIAARVPLDLDDAGIYLAALDREAVTAGRLGIHLRFLGPTRTADRPAAWVLADALKRDGYLHTPSVEGAFRVVQRHFFLPETPERHFYLPGAPARDAYANEALPLKVIDGQVVASSTQPALLAVMLEELDVRPGQRVLEVGTGMGYTAALLAHLTGPTGHVTSIELDPELAEQARDRFARMGIGTVHVITGDGQHHDPPLPYDRILVTGAVDNIAPEWRTQLAADGRLVAPTELTSLDALNNMQMLVAFAKRDDYLVSDSIHWCGALPLRGTLAPARRGSMTLAP